MNEGTEELIKVLLGSNVKYKSDEHIKLSDYHRVAADYSKLKENWSKACFIFYLSKHKSKSIKAISKKLIRNSKLMDRAIYIRYIEPYVNEIKKLDFLHDKDKIIHLLIGITASCGQEEYTTLCRAINSSGGSWVLSLNNVSISKSNLMSISEKY